MSESDEFTTDTTSTPGGGFVGVVRCQGRTIWMGEVQATKSAALGDAGRHMRLERIAQEKRDDQRFTMDLAADLVGRSWDDDGGLFL